MRQDQSNAWDSIYENNEPFDAQKLLDYNPTGQSDWGTLPDHVRFYYSIYKLYERVVFFQKDEFEAYDQNLNEFLNS